MYKTSRHTKDFRLDSVKDVALYDLIIGNPLCTIISKEIKTTKDEETDDTGLTRKTEDLHVIITYDEKELL